MTRRRWIALAVVALALLFAWRLGERKSRVRPPTPAPLPTPAPPPPPAAHPMPELPAPALHLGKPAAVRITRTVAPGSLQGSVVDADSGEGIAGTVLTFSHDDGAYSTISLPGGGFRFAPREAGRYGLVSVEAKGYAPFEGEFDRSPVSFTSVPGKDVTGVVLRLARARSADAGVEPQPAGGELGDAGAEPAYTGSLRGRVFDARSGAAVPAFAIALWRVEGLRYAAMLSASFVDASGAYEITGLPPGNYEAAALAGGYAGSQYAPVQVGDSAATADFALHPGARISGTVIDATTRRGIAGASVSLEGRRGDAPDLPVAPSSPATETGADGQFVLEHVPAESVGLRVAKAGYLERLVQLGALPPDGDLPPLTVELSLRPAGSDAQVELTGIGAILRPRRDTLRIVEVVPNAGAADAGLAAGDDILAIDGARVGELGYERAIAAIRGPVGTTVTLRIRRSGREWDVMVTRKLVRA